MISELANHLWQSTLFAVAIGLLTLMCRKNHASVRYWLWFSASVKFFIPFTLLMALGDRLEWASRAPQIAAPAVSATLAQVSRPFVVDPAVGFLSVQEAPRSVDWFALAILGVWVAGTIAMIVVRFRTWRRIRAAVARELALDHCQSAHARGHRRAIDSGSDGARRRGSLASDTARAVRHRRRPDAAATGSRADARAVSHRRGDNVTAAVHMIAEAVFWFHPLVWWIGSRLVDERERACDEEVVRTCGEPQTYAEGIVNVCKRYVESPLACVSGVSGSNVKNRIRDIMTNRAVAKLSVAKKTVLASVGAMALVAPILAQSVPLPSAPDALRGGIGERADLRPARCVPATNLDVAAREFHAWRHFRSNQRDAGVGHPASPTGCGISRRSARRSGSTPIDSTSRREDRKAPWRAKPHDDSNPFWQSGSP